MPAIGWAKTDERMTWGVGVFAQGGMGTEYGANSMLAMGSDQQAMRSELGVGRVIFPLAYRVNNRLTVGGSLDYVWASLDMAMATSTQRLGMMVTGGTMAAQVPQMMQMNGGATAGRIAFSDTNDFTGAASATGWGTKLGMTYEVNDKVRIGASYHAKTQLSDMETGATAAGFSMNNGVSDTGKITVRDFQWPATTAFGVQWQATPKLSLAADIKHLAWSDVMKSFNMTYTSNQMAPGATLDFALPQNWKDQTVTMLGVAYQVSDATTLRAGVNLASNPIPSDLTHPLFPAIVKNHYTFGVGHLINDRSSINFSMTVAPEVAVLNNSGPSMPSPEPAMTIKHSQTNFQLMYSYRY
jgi:long-chain fatty acid transport protein